jgi:hypothetical protein
MVLENFVFNCAFSATLTPSLRVNKSGWMIFYMTLFYIG